MSTTLNTRVQSKRDTSPNWTQKNPVLLDGEVIVVDTNSGDVRFKVGNGTSTYTQLPFQDEPIYNQINTKLTTPSGTQGQFLGFTSDNVVGAVDAPTSTSPFNTSYNGTLASGSGNWTASGGQYYQQITLSEITSTQTRLVFPQWTTNITNEQTAWNSLLNIETFDGYVRFYASVPTTTNVNFVLMYTNYTSELVELVTSGSGTVGTFTPV